MNNNEERVRSLLTREAEAAPRLDISVSEIISKGRRRKRMRAIAVATSALGLVGILSGLGVALTGLGTVGDPGPAGGPGATSTLSTEGPVHETTPTTTTDQGSTTTTVANSASTAPPATSTTTPPSATTTLPPGLEAPTDLEVVQRGSMFTLTWLGTEDAVEYVVAELFSKGPIEIGRTAETSLTFQLELSGASSTVTVTALAADGSQSAESEPLLIVPEEGEQ